jgi:hypothetical protein
MDEMKELVTVAQAEQVILLVAIALPPAGLVLGAAVGAVRKRVALGALAGLLCGMAGPAALVMWRIYNAIIGRYGLDSVKALLINLALFAALGAVIGLAVGYLTRRRGMSSQINSGARHPQNQGGA